MLMINSLKGILKLGNSTSNNRMLLSMAVLDLRMKLIQSLLKNMKKVEKRFRLYSEMFNETIHNKNFKKKMI